MLLTYKSQYTILKKIARSAGLVGARRVQITYSALKEERTIRRSSRTADYNTDNSGIPQDVIRQSPQSLDQDRPKLETIHSTHERASIGEFSRTT